MVGAGAASLAASRYLAGCGGSDAPDGGLDLAYPHTDQAPTLEGDPAKGFWLRGNYAPVTDEIEALDLEVLGAIPPELNGVFMRNSANPKSGETDHWFLGDGMLHGVRLEKGKASWYRNRWVQTAAYTGGESTSPAANRANTALLKHHGRVLALYEVGLPHEVSTQDLGTVGPYDFAGALGGAMSAHPKVDPNTGELCFIGYSPFPPYLKYHTVDPSGALVRTVEIEIPAPTMMHDFQLTSKHAVFYDLPIVFDLARLQSGFPFRWSPDAGARIGILPRDGQAADVDATVTWVDIDLCYMFHSFNAYDTADGKVVLEGCRMASLWAGGTDSLAESPIPWRWTVDPKTGSVSEGAFHDVSVDFPQIDDRLQGLEHRIDYGLKLAAPTDDYPTHPIGVLKHDRQAGTTDLWSAGEAVQPDEAIFVPAPDATAEDAGWLLTVVYNRATAKSEVVILDASSVSSGPVARILLPRRVPFGFHGIWAADAAAG